MLEADIAIDGIGPEDDGHAVRQPRLQVGRQMMLASSSYKTAHDPWDGLSGLHAWVKNGQFRLFYCECP